MDTKYCNEKWIRMYWINTFVPYKNKKKRKFIWYFKNCMLDTLSLNWNTWVSFLKVLYVQKSHIINMFFLHHWWPSILWIRSGKMKVCFQMYQINWSKETMQRRIGPVLNWFVFFRQLVRFCSKTFIWDIDVAAWFSY